MLEFASALASSLCYGTWNAVSKKNIEDNGLFKALTCSYAGMVPLLLAGAILTGQPFAFPLSLAVPYALEVMIGAMAIIAFFKAFEVGEASVLAPLSNLYIFIVLVVSVAFLGESPSAWQVLGSLILVLSAIAVAFKDVRRLKVERGVLFLLFTILGWGYYYSFIKAFVPVLGAYMANLYLEFGIMCIVLLYGAATRKDMSLPKAGGRGYVLLGILLLSFGSFLATYSVGTIGAALTTAILASGTIFTEVASYLLLKEKLQRAKYAAILLMVAGLLLVILG